MLAPEQKRPKVIRRFSALSFPCGGPPGWRSLKKSWVLGWGDTHAKDHPAYYCLLVQFSCHLKRKKRLYWSVAILRRSCKKYSESRHCTPKWKRFQEKKVTPSGEGRMGTADGKWFLPRGGKLVSNTSYWNGRFVPLEEDIRASMCDQKCTV